MKFTRMLSLAVAAAAALSFTACDDEDSSTSPNGSSAVTTVTLNLGTQGSAATSASAFSVRTQQQYGLGNLASGAADWNNIDVFVFVDPSAGADTTKATFFSPDQFVIDFAGGSTVGKMTAASKTLSTRFVKLEGLDGDDWTSISTADDVKELVGDIDWANDGVKKTTVSKDDIFAIKANDGSVGLIRITAVERPGEKKFQVNLQARLLK
jgi:hypothetical protein